MKKEITTVLLLLIILFGFWFRLQGIINNHSFWADEALVSSFARFIVQEKTNLIDGMMKISYEPIQIGITALSFKFFGFSEFGARLPSVFFGTIAILFAYLITKKLSSSGGGLLAAFLIAFSQLNLSNSTQAKPYIAIQTLLFIIIYLLLSIKLVPQKSLKISKLNIQYLLKNNSSFIIFHSLALILLIISFYIHRISLLTISFYLPYLLIQFNIIKLVKRQTKFVLLLLVIGIIIAILSGIMNDFINLFIIKSFANINFLNNIILGKNLFIRQYGIFILPALFGSLFILNKFKAISLSFLIFTFTTIFIWITKSYSHNIRYLVPVFGLIFVFFGVFIGKVGEYIGRWTIVGKQWLIPSIIIIILIITQYKIYFQLTNDYRLRSIYFSPNTDFYGDIQVANYKTMYLLIKNQIPDYKNIAIFNDIIDAHRWYMPEKKINAYFMKGTKKPYKHPVEGGIIYGSISDFLKEKSKYQKGILIVEDWESFLPEDIKQYAKKNMKLEIRVNSLKEAPDDPWPLEVYSWGMN